MGTYLGEPADSPAYREAAAEALAVGINLFDTAINYRHQASERDIGAAIGAAISSGTLARDEVIVSTKGGFLPLDFEDGLDNPRGYLAREFLTSGLCPPGEVVAGCQCLAPAYLSDQLDRSRRNLGLETIDVYFLHNPELQLREVTRAVFNRRISAAFEMLEGRVAEGALQYYGVATWDGLRQPDGAAEALVLEDLLRAAVSVGGSNHHFRALQLPVNLAMSEALRLVHDQSQWPGRTILEVAADQGLMVMASASLMQGHLAAEFPAGLRAAFPGAETDAQRALQHTRSARGVTTALAGMKTAAHVRENAGVLRQPALAPAWIARLYQAAREG
jgi:aryl-alcohol dehydrogenase-like predicted oxidoreductase